MNLLGFFRAIEFLAGRRGALATVSEFLLMVGIGFSNGHFFSNGLDGGSRFESGFEGGFE